jgi:hypothetical protein
MTPVGLWARPGGRNFAGTSNLPVKSIKRGAFSSRTANLNLGGDDVVGVSKETKQAGKKDRGQCREKFERCEVGTAHLPRELERAMGIEPTSEAWEASILPLYDARSR